MKKTLALLLLGATGFITLQNTATNTLWIDIAMAKEEQNNKKFETMNTAHLSEEQKYITLHDGTERAFTGKYWDNKEPGIYVDVITGEALFSSTDKFDSGSGWPSFTQPIDDNFIQKKEDKKFGMTRTEVRSNHSDTHLGHVFDDGPRDKGGKRYCINSAALKFVPVADLNKEGYGQYLELFVGRNKK